MTTYIYINGELGQISNFEETDKVGLGFSFYLLREINRFIKYLWAVKDNNIYIRDGFLIAYPINYEDVGTYKASLSAINSTSGSSKDFLCTYSNNELEKEISLMNSELFDFHYEADVRFDPNLKYPTSDIFLKSKKPTRYMRAFIFISLARSYHTVPLKINLYINALESLFTTYKTELNYKISERGAFLEVALQKEKNCLKL